MSKGPAPTDLPPAYGSQTTSPQHLDAGPANAPSQPPQAHMNQGYPAANKPYAAGAGYYQPGPMQYGPPQPQGYGPPQGGYYGQPQQGYYGQPQPGYYGAPGYYGRPQGQYVDQRNQGTGDGLLAALACCCCLDACLLF